MGLLSLLLLVGCADQGSVDSAEPSCNEWPVQVGDRPVFGGNARGAIAVGEPSGWPLDISRELEVEAGHVQLTSLNGRAVYGDFEVDGGLALERIWSTDGWMDITYDSPLMVWPMPIPDSWQTSARFSDAVVGHVVNAGIDTWTAQRIDRVDLDLDGIVFGQVAVVEATLERELVVSTGTSSWTETAWISPCHGLIARNREGEAMRLIP